MREQESEDPFEPGRGETPSRGDSAGDYVPVSASSADDTAPSGASQSGAASAPSGADGAPPKLEFAEPSGGRLPKWLKNTLEMVVIIAIAIAVAFEVQAHVVKPYRIPSGSMIPTLDIGQRILVDRLDTHPKLGDVVVFHPPIGADSSSDPICGDPDAGNGHSKPCDRSLPDEASVTFVKRVVGLPGDRIAIKNGIVYRNGKPEKLPYSIEQSGTASGYVSCSSGGLDCTFPASITVPAGEYYMMGDNRGDSLDSRFWGPVPQKWIIGVAFFTYWPLDRIGSL